MSETKLQGEKLAQACARIARDMKAEEVEVLDLRGISSIADFFVLASANSMPHLRALSREVSARVVEEGGPKPTYREGVVESSWLVLDYIDVMVHVFQREKRDYYDLGRLWKDAKRVDGPIGLEAGSGGAALAGSLFAGAGSDGSGADEDEGGDGGAEVFAGDEDEGFADEEE